MALFLIKIINYPKKWDIKKETFSNLSFKLPPDVILFLRSIYIYCLLFSNQQDWRHYILYEYGKASSQTVVKILPKSRVEAKMITISFVFQTQISLSWNYVLVKRLIFFIYWLKTYGIITLTPPPPKHKYYTIKTLVL